MIWLSLVTSLALAQDPDPLQFNANAATESDAGTLAEPVDAQSVVAEPAIAPAPASTPRPRPAAQTAPVATAAPLLDPGWLFSFGGPLVLLVGVGGALWYIRKNGLRVGGLDLSGLRALAGGSAAEGVQIRVTTRAALAGQDGLAVVEVDGLAQPRQLLVTTGPGGCRLIADLSRATPKAATVASTEGTEDTVARVMRQMLASGWTAPQGLAQSAAPPVPAVAPLVSAPPAAVPSAHGLALTSAGIAPVSTHAAPAPEAAAEPVANHAFERHLEDEVQSAQHRPEDGPGGSPADPPPRTRGPSSYSAHSEGPAVRSARPRTQDRIELGHSREPARDRTEDWRSASYRSAAREESPNEEDLVDVIGEHAAAFRERHARPAARRTRSTRTHRRSSGHLAQLAASEVAPNARRVGGERRRNVLRQAGSRQERTEAARALLEKVMAQRAGETR